MPTDADLRFVAETVGFHRDGTSRRGSPLYRYPGTSGMAMAFLVPDLHADDAAAALHLLPWLRASIPDCGPEDEPFNIEFDPVLGCRTVWMGSASTQWFDSFAAALFDLTLQLAKENPT